MKKIIRVCDTCKEKVTKHECNLCADDLCGKCSNEVEIQIGTGIFEYEGYRIREGGKDWNGREKKTYGIYRKGNLGWYQLKERSWRTAEYDTLNKAIKSVKERIRKNNGRKGDTQKVKWVTEDEAIVHMI